MPFLSLVPFNYFFYLCLLSFLTVIESVVMIESDFFLLFLSSLIFNVVEPDLSTFEVIVFLPYLVFLFTVFDSSFTFYDFLSDTLFTIFYLVSLALTLSFLSVDVFFVDFLRDLGF